MWWTILSWTHTSFLMEVRQRLQHITFYIDILQFSINENYDKHKKRSCMEVPYSFMTCPGIEPGFTPWEGVVLTAWPTGRNRGDKIRTCDLCVPNAALYQTEPRLDVLERLFCAVYQRLVYNSMTLKKMQAFFWKNFNFLKKSFFGESSGIKKNLTKPYFIRKNSNRWVWESCAASRKKNVRKVHRNQKIRKETWKFNKNQQEFSHLYRWWDELPSLA